MIDTETAKMLWDIGITMDNSIAMEAPYDVTERVSQQVEDLNNRAAAQNQPEEEPAPEEEEVPAEDEAAIDEATTEEEPIDDTTTEEEGVDDTGEEPIDDGTGTDEEGMDETPIEDEEPVDEKDFANRVRVHENTLAFLDMVTNCRDTFTNKYNHDLETERYHDYHIILRTFNSLIDSMEKCLKTKFSNDPYEVLVKYYVSFNKTFDIITRMVDRFVIEIPKEELDKNGKPIKKKSTKKNTDTNSETNK